MASRPGSLPGVVGLSLLCWGCCLCALAQPAPPARVLLEDSFAQAAVGSQPAPWIYFVDAGNAAAVAEAPLRGGHCLKLIRGGGSIWKPMVSGGAAGVPGSHLRLQLDFYLPALSSDNGPSLYVTLRGNGNLNHVQVGVGGPGGVAVPLAGRGWVPLGFPLHAGEWGHLVITADPIGRQGDGAFDLTISQGDDELTVPNIAFQPSHEGKFPDELWYSPTLHAGGGTPEHPNEALVTAVRLETLPVGRPGP